MADFMSIWKFVEEELKVVIPPYIKYVLKSCGYDNCHTIAAIEEIDLEYFETEVRKGCLDSLVENRVVNTSDVASVKNALEGSITSAEEFEFSRGHRKLIMTFVKLVKEKLNENGVNGFTRAGSRTNKLKRKKSIVQKLLAVPSNVTGDVTLKRQKYDPDDDLSQVDILEYHKKTLTNKATLSLKAYLESLKKISPEQYETNLEIIQRATMSDLVRVVRKVDKEPLCVAKIECPICKHRTSGSAEGLTVFHKLTEANNTIGTWNASNFGRHFSLVHLKKNREKDHNWKKDAFRFENYNDGLNDDPNDIVTHSNDLEGSLNDNLEPDVDDIDVQNATGNQFVDLNLNVGSIISMKNAELINLKHFKPPIVNYSDTDEDDGEEQVKFLVEVPSHEKLTEFDDIAFSPSWSINRKTENKLQKELVSSGVYSHTIEIETRARTQVKTYKDENIFESKQLNARSLEPLNHDSNNVQRAFKAKVEMIPIFRNGHQSTDIRPNILTINTCAFDSIFFIYAGLYFDDQNYRDEIDFFFQHSNFCYLLKKYYETYHSKLSVQSEVKSFKPSSCPASCELYDDRNNILKEMFTNYYKNTNKIIKNSKDIFIDCRTGVCEFFGRLSPEMSENIASGIELKLCGKCNTTKGKILPFYTVDIKELDLRNIQKSITSNRASDRSHGKICFTCKRECKIQNYFGNVLAIEIEPNVEIESQSTISIHNLTKRLTLETDYRLFGVIQYDASRIHFLSHVKRKNNMWKTYDDLKDFEADTDLTKEIMPYMLFYARSTCYKNDFIETLKTFFIKKSFTNHS